MLQEEILKLLAGKTLQEGILKLLEEIKEGGPENKIFKKKVRVDIFVRTLLKNSRASKSNYDNINVRSVEEVKMWSTKEDKVVSMLSIWFTDDDSVRMKGVFDKIAREVIIDPDDMIHKC